MIEDNNNNENVLTELIKNMVIDENSLVLPLDYSISERKLAYNKK